MRNTRHILCLTILVATILFSTSLAQADAERKQVLYLNSYQNGYTWSDNILEGLRATFKESGFVVDLQVEYMDAKKHPGIESQSLLKQLFKSKFSNTSFDAIIGSDNAAFQFLLTNHKELFPDVPVVFCGVNDLNPELLTEHKRFTGVMEELDIVYNLNLALTLNPEKKQVVVVGDGSLSSQAIVAQIKAVMPEFANKLAFQFWDDIQLENLLTKSRSMPDDSFIFYVPFYVETEGKYLSAGEIVKALYDNANVPIYGAWSFLLGHGIVGGRLLDGMTQGKVAAGMVVEILEGNPVPAAVSGAASPAPIVFDWEVLDKFGLTSAQLPDGAVFINRPLHTYQLEREVVWTVVILLCTLAAFTIMMAASRQRAVNAEKELAVSRKMLRSVIDTIPQLIYWKDLRSQYLGANRGFADFFGLNASADVEGKSSREILEGKQFAEKGEEIDRKVIQKNASVLHEVVTYDDAEHPEVVFELNKVPLHDDEGNLTGVLTTAEDISGRLELERQLIQSQKLEAVGTFVGGIAHDFNNLLTTVINSTELALLDAEGSVAEDVERARAAAEHGSKLVSQILTYARPSCEGTGLIDPAIPINEALSLVEHRLPGSVRFTKDVPAQLGKGMADPSHLQQIAMNLCTNAIQAMGKSGGELTVQLRIRNEGEARELHLMVRDTGPGIPQKALKRVFDPFFSTKDRQEGTGLGLAIVHGIVHGHGGHIKLASQPGETVFDIHIPFAVGEEVAQEATQMNVSGTERILFVEDDKDQLALVPRSLATLGYDVTPAAGGKEALELAMAGERFDLVVTDFDMPGLNGVELTRTLRQLHPELPVIIVSGGKDAAIAAQGESGVAQIVVKPYTGSSLAATIRETLARKKAEND